MGHYLSEMLHPEPYQPIKPEVDYSEFYIIHSNGLWKIYPKHGERSKANFKHRDLAFHEAVGIVKQYQAKLIVHNKDGGIDFRYDYYYKTELQKRANNLR